MHVVGESDIATAQQLEHTPYESGGLNLAMSRARIAFQTETGDEFTVAVEPLTHGRVVALMSANQTIPGVACELLRLEAAPRAALPA